jgi:hypothetical protein
MSHTITLLDPTGEAPSSDAAGAAGLDTLSGMRIGLLYNNKANQGRILLEALRDELLAAGAEAAFIVAKDSRARPAEPRVVEELHARAHAVVNGVAD